MVLWQLCTLEHLRTSSFGCPPPRHGLQLLFWFANDCVTSDPHITMKVTGSCQQEFDQEEEDTSDGRKSLKQTHNPE